jgi:hypothetical protein
VARASRRYPHRSVEITVRQDAARRLDPSLKRQRGARGALRKHARVESYDGTMLLASHNRIHFAQRRKQNAVDLTHPDL